MDEQEVSLIEQLISIHYEQAQRRKALRLLQKQTWSFEFLSAMLSRAARASGVPLTLQVENTAGQKFTLTADGTEHSALDEDDIFNHLDDEAAVQSFITQHSRR